MAARPQRRSTPTSNDPLGDKAREVRARYRGVCRGCGAPTSARNGKGDAYAYCKCCRPGAITRQWTRQRVREAMRAWRARYGAAPSSCFSVVAVLVGAVIVLAPAWLQLGAYDRQDSAHIAAQRRADDTEGAALDRLVAVIKDDGGGRAYAGMPDNWGASFVVGQVPVFKDLESRSRRPGRRPLLLGPVEPDAAGRTGDGCSCSWFTGAEI